MLVVLVDLGVILVVLLDMGGDFCGFAGFGGVIWVISHDLG